MGAEFNSIQMPTSDKEAISKNWEARVEESLYEHGHSYSGCIGMLGTVIDWSNVKPFDNSTEAEEYLAENHCKWDNGMAVPYKREKDVGYVIGGWCSS